MDLGPLHVWGSIFGEPTVLGCVLGMTSRRGDPKRGHMGVSENKGYLILRSLYWGSCNLNGTILGSPIFGDPHIE